MIEVTRHCRWPPPHSRIAVLLRNPFRPEPPGSRLFARYRHPSSDAHIGTGSPAAFVVQPSVKICQTRGGWLGRVARLHGRLIRFGAPRTRLAFTCFLIHLLRRW